MEKKTRLKSYRIVTKKSELELEMIYNFLTNSYWAKGRSREAVKKSIENSLCFGIFKFDTQVGFARIITDKVTFAYLADVFVLPDHRGLGLSKMMLNFILEHPDLRDVKSIMLATKDAHKLYTQFGFRQLDRPEKFMILKSTREEDQFEERHL